MHFWRRAALLALAAALGPSLAHAVDPLSSRPIRMIVPFPPGGSTDILGRAIAAKLQESLGQPVVVENKPGAGGSIGATEAARSAGDGHTLLMGHIGTLAINPSLYPNLPYDPRKSFAPVALVARVPNVLVVNPQVPVKDVAELIALAKAKPGKLNFAIGALGSSVHLAGEAFKMMSGTYIVNIPYKGTAPAIQDVLAGQVEMMFANVGNAQAHVRVGKLKALGVTSPKRLPQFPDVPAIAEVLPGYQSSAWFGLFGPARMPPELARRISDAARQAIGSAEVKKRIEFEGATPVGNTPEEFGRYVHEEIVRWAKVVKYSGAKPE